MIQLKIQIHICDIYVKILDCFEKDKFRLIKFFYVQINLLLVLKHIN
jgi:hypothetical protein